MLFLWCCCLSLSKRLSFSFYDRAFVTNGPTLFEAPLAVAMRTFHDREYRHKTHTANIPRTPFPCTGIFSWLGAITKLPNLPMRYALHHCVSLTHSISPMKSKPRTTRGFSLCILAVKERVTRCSQYLLYHEGKNQRLKPLFCLEKVT